jgi:hypothetical protein
MSAFLVTEKTLYNCMKAITKAQYSALYKDIDGSQKKFKIIFMALNSLNSLALKVRYNEEPSPGYKFCSIKYTEASSCKIQLLKSLQCLIYQCSEGSVVETGLYKKLIEVKNDLQDLIISDMPEYKKAVWDNWK